MSHVDKARLSAFLDGEATEEERREIVEHLNVCLQCQSEAEELSEIGELFGCLPDVEVPPYFLARLKQRITEENATSSSFWCLGRTRRFGLQRVMVPVCATALFLFSLFLGYRLGMTIYEGRREVTARADVHLSEDLGLTSFDDFPEGSLGDEYIRLLSGGGE
ncbi:hypothetical protein AMJ40_07340 [candidate division TA06 bacterium DG_26]|uniref:Putative zinc-finger domain-containing protein n=1 Tax=candidate division TA06 bacterium DG_26 TaxID=1703771 RepID=A0A0S7WFT7_UNCT6|nr:MAG: hypothetical protein AMJ40_07340 [candidate division TA06 bacterium DG_26]